MSANQRASIVSLPVTGALRAILAATMPATMRAFARRLAEIEPGARRIFIIEFTRRLLCCRTASAEVLPIRPRRIVFVCHGNILRSPMAATLFSRALAGCGLVEFSVASAGLHARSGRPADPRGVEAALEWGVDLSGHRAHLLSAEMVETADLIVIMDYANEAECLARFPAVRSKLRLLGTYDPDGDRRSMEITDPYTGVADDVRRCYDEVARCVQGLEIALVSTVK